MRIKKKWLLILLGFKLQSINSNLLIEDFKQTGYLEICDQNNGSIIFDQLYTYFDELIAFLQANPTWTHKLYAAKECFIRNKAKSQYSTDFFGFYDESNRPGRDQISFYYSTHLHDFIYAQYPKFKSIPQITNFFESCLQIQKNYIALFREIAIKLEIAQIFDSTSGQPPILLKVIKYLPTHIDTRPHYDGTAFTLLVDSTDNQALLLSPYKATFTINDFNSPLRRYARTPNQNSHLLIPGTLLTDFNIYPTPHIVIKNNKTRYATVAFAMRPNFIAHKQTLTPLPKFKH